MFKVLGYKVDNLVRTSISNNVTQDCIDGLEHMNRWDRVLVGFIPLLQQTNVQTHPSHNLMDLLKLL